MSGKPYSRHSRIKKIQLLRWKYLKLVPRNADQRVLLQSCHFALTIQETTKIYGKPEIVETAIRHLWIMNSKALFRSDDEVNYKSKRFTR